MTIPLNYIYIALGCLSLGFSFWGGYSLGLSSKKKRLDPAEYQALGEEFDIKMRELIDENKQHIRRWELMAKFISALGGVRDETKLASLLSRLVRENINVKYSAVLLLRDDNFVAVASDGLHVESEKNLKISSKDSLIEYIKTTKGIVVLSRMDRKFFTFKIKESVGEMLVMGLKTGEDLKGLLWLADKTNSQKFTEGDKAILEYLGHAAGNTFSNTLLMNELESRAVKIVTGLAKALEQRDQYTRGHSDHVATYSSLFARSLGVSKSQINIIYTAALLHDMGKIGIPDEILNKPGRLTPEEFEVIKSHPLYGAELLKILGFLKDELVLILHHHEKFDGTGYPYRLKGNQIPLGSQIISLADVFDALTTHRPYRDAFSVEKALEIMKKMKGENFEPGMLEQFIEFIEKKMGQKFIQEQQEIPVQ